MHLLFIQNLNWTRCPLFYLATLVAQVYPTPLWGKRVMFQDFRWIKCYGTVSMNYSNLQHTSCSERELQEASGSGLSAYISSTAGRELALGSSPSIAHVAHIRVHLWLCLWNDFYMLVETCSMLLFSSFLYLVIEYGNCFKTTQMVNYDLVTPIWEQQIPSPCLLCDGSLVQNVNSVPLFSFHWWSRPWW